MGKRVISFYNVRTRRTVRTSNWKLRSIRTPNGKRWMAVANDKGVTMTQFISGDE